MTEQSDEFLAGGSSERSGRRQQMVLLQLKRLAPQGGQLTSDCSARVPRSDRLYELRVERHEQQPWENSLRRKARLRPFRPSAPPMQLVPRCRPMTRPRAQKPKTEPAGLPIIPQPLESTPDDAASYTSELLLPANLHQETIMEGYDDLPHELPNLEPMSPRSKELQWSNTWPLPQGAGSDKLMSASVSISSVSDGREAKSMGSAREFSHRYSIRPLSARRRSWLKANTETTKGKNQGFVSQRNQLREMVATMMKTMTQTFDRSVWAACEACHPEEVIELERAREKKILEDQIDQFKGLSPAGLIKTRRSSRRDSMRRRSFGITAGSSKVGALPAAEKPDEKVLANLAKQTGWSVLDVEETWEIFSSHAPTGRIGAHSDQFVNLMQELYRGVTDEEIMLLQQHIKAMRTRNTARGRFMRKALAGMDSSQERSDVRFSEFYVAMVKWLNLQAARVEASKAAKELDPRLRCSLTRFSLYNEPLIDLEDIMSDSQGSVDNFRRLKREVDESLRGPHQGTQGLANAVLTKRRIHQDRPHYEELYEEDEDVEEENWESLRRSIDSSIGHDDLVASRRLSF